MQAWFPTGEPIHECGSCPPTSLPTGFATFPTHRTVPHRPLKWRLLRIPTSSTTPIPTCVCSQKLWGLIFLVLEPWAGLSSVGLGFLAQEISLLTFIHHTWVCDCHSNLWTSVPLYVSLPSYLSGWMWHLYFLGCWTSIQPDFLSILGDTCFVV